MIIFETIRSTTRNLNTKRSGSGSTRPYWRFNNKFENRRSRFSSNNVMVVRHMPELRWYTKYARRRSWPVYVYKLPLAPPFTTCKRDRHARVYVYIYIWNQRRSCEHIIYYSSRRRSFKILRSRVVKSFIIR